MGNLAREQCAHYQAAANPCWHSHIVPGMYMMFGDKVVMTMTALATWSGLGRGTALIPRAWEWGVGAGGAVVAGGAVTSLYGEIRSWFAAGNHTSQEEKYLDCLRQLEGLTPTLHAQLIKLSEKASLQKLHREAMHRDLVALGVNDIHELNLMDWQALPLWANLTAFEKKRLEAQITASYNNSGAMM